ncbi:MAG: hypothetical protein HYZ34_09255 [Ignavibacteriae bacterium]|nr:hypothetical protein [Ignavibacteriota bacterium]
MDIDRLKWVAFANRRPIKLEVIEKNKTIDIKKNFFGRRLIYEVDGQIFTYLSSQPEEFFLNTTVSEKIGKDWKFEDSLIILLARDALQQITSNTQSHFVSLDQRLTYLVTANEISNAIAQEGRLAVEETRLH